MYTRKPVILVVEDEDDINHIICEGLRDEDFVPIPVCNGKDALAVARAKMPDAVLLDIMLPGGIDGYEICLQLKTHRATNLIPIMMLTGRTNQRDRVQGIRVGADEYVTKPFDIRQVIKKLRALLARKSSLIENGVRGEVSIGLESDVRYLEQMNDMLTNLFEHTPFEEEDMKKIRYSIMEMGQNAIEWGNKNQTHLLVRLTYRIDNEKVVFEISDEGEGFDSTDIPHAAKPDDPLSHSEIREKLGLREGGFGILISRSFMDKVEYNSRGNTVTLMKYFANEKHSDPNQVS